MVAAKPRHTATSAPGPWQVALDNLRVLDDASSLAGKESSRDFA